MDRNTELRIGLAAVASVLTACATSGPVEVPSTPVQPAANEAPIVYGPGLDEVVPDAEVTLNRRYAQGGFVYGPWWRIPCPPDSTSFGFYNLAGTQGEGPHAVTGGINPSRGYEENRLYANANNPNGNYRGVQRLNCHQPDGSVLINGFFYRITIED